MSYTKVAVAGASGNLGPAVVEGLLKAGFEVTALTRSTSSNTFPTGVKVAPVDFESEESLVNALKGQDVVVSTIATMALDKQLLLVEAAAKAGVKRFLPSEFGSDTTNAKAQKLPVFGHKIAVQDALKKHAANGGMSYTLVITGPFFDWGMMVGFVASPKAKKVVLYDGGDRVFSTTTLTTIGNAVAGVLKHPKETENRPVFVQDTAISLKDLTARAKNITGSDGWTEDVVTIQSCLDKADAEIKKPDANPGIWAIEYIKASIWGEGYGTPFSKLDNELLGIKQFSDSEIDAVIKRYA